MNISRLLSEYVERNGIKQIYIANKTGIPPDTISKILNNKRRMMADEFLEICFALNIDPNIFKKSA